MTPPEPETADTQQEAIPPPAPVCAPDPLAHLSPTIQSILNECELTPLASSLCFQCAQATVLQLSSPDGQQNAGVVHCSAMNRDIQVVVRRCTSHQPNPSSP